MMLAYEAHGVVALRMMKLMRGGREARREAKLMVSEKIHAASEATASLMAGASGESDFPDLPPLIASKVCDDQAGAPGTISAWR